MNWSRIERERLMSVRRSIFLSFLPVLLLCGFLQGQAGSECEATQGKKTKVIEGTVCYGQSFEERFGDIYEFRLQPESGGYGWTIQLVDTNQDFDISRLTPPLHGVNPRNIEGWHFRNEDNSGPNRGDVNVPQRIRTFRFSPDVPALIKGYPDAVTPRAVQKVADFGTGTLYILDFGLADLQRGQKARMVWLKFKVCLQWRP